MAKFKFNPKNPVTNWYFGDQLNDPGLKLCSLPAIGLWWQCLALAAFCIPYGHLSKDGRALSPDDLAVLLPGNHAALELAPLLDELLEKGVASRTKSGVVYSRRMVRDARKKGENSKNGRSGVDASQRKLKEKYGSPQGGLQPPLEPNTSSYTHNPLTPFPERDLARWKLRVDRFYSTGNWISQWGGKPNEQEYQGPRELLRKENP